MLYPQQNDFRNKLDLSGIWDFKTDPDHAGEGGAWFNGLTGRAPSRCRAAGTSSTRTCITTSTWPGMSRGPMCRRPGRASGSSSASARRTTTARSTSTARRSASTKAGTCRSPSRSPNRSAGTPRTSSPSASRTSSSRRACRPGNMTTALGAFASFPRTTFDFFPFAGIHRPVVLYSVPQTHIEDVTVVTEIDGADGTVTVTVRLNEPVDGAGHRDPDAAAPTAGERRPGVQGRRGRGDAAPCPRPASGRTTIRISTT